jgi:hypothetical protein
MNNGIPWLAEMKPQSEAGMKTEKEIEKIIKTSVKFD